MLRIKINGQWSVLFPNTRIKYVYNSPAFSDKALVGDFSYALSFPTEPNSKTFGYIERPDVTIVGNEYSCEVYPENNRLIKGIFVVSKATSEKIQGNLINVSYDLSNRIKGKTTKDLIMSDFDRYTGTNTEIVAASHIGSYPDFHFAHFPIWNYILHDGTIDEEDWHETRYINRYVYSETNIWVDVLFPYLAYVVDSIFDTFGVNLKTNCIADHTELVKLVMINMYRDKKVPWNEERYPLVDSIVKYPLEDLLQAINNTFCTGIFFDPRNRQAEILFLKDLLNSSDYVDWTDKVVGEVEKETELESKKGNFVFSFDSTDESMSEMQLEQGILDNATITATVATPDDLPEYANMDEHAGEIQYVLNNQAYYIIVGIPNEVEVVIYGWHFLSWDFFGKMIDPDGDDHETKLSTCGMRYKLKFPNFDFRMTVPTCDQSLYKSNVQGILKYLTYSDENYNLVAPYFSDFEPRVLFYRGMHPNEIAENYPLGTSGKHDSQGTEIGTLSMRWDGADGLYENFWKEWAEFINAGKIFNYKIKLDMLDILNLNIKKKVRIGNKYYLIKKLSVEIPINQPAQVELVQK